MARHLKNRLMCFPYRAPLRVGLHNLNGELQSMSINGHQITIHCPDWQLMANKLPLNTHRLTD